MYFKECEKYIIMFGAPTNLIEGVWIGNLVTCLYTAAV